MKEEKRMRTRSEEQEEPGDRNERKHERVYMYMCWKIPNSIDTDIKGKIQHITYSILREKSIVP